MNFTENERKSRSNTQEIEVYNYFLLYNLDAGALLDVISNEHSFFHLHVPTDIGPRYA